MKWSGSGPNDSTMGELHEAYLNIGSNIEPEHHLREAIRLLREQGKVKAISNAWQSHAFGSDGPDFLNACVLFLTQLKARELKAQVIRPIEARLGRIRGTDKYAPRTIDIDIILFDDEPFGGEFWSNAFVVVPLADLLPDFHHPFNLRAAVQSRCAHASPDLDRKAPGCFGFNLVE